MADLMANIYLGVAVILFLLCVATQENPYGRGTDGQPNIVAAFLIGIFWPVWAVLAIMAGAYAFVLKFWGADHD